MTLAKFADDCNENWYKINRDNVFESFENGSLKVVSQEVIEKYNIKAGDSLNKFEENEELQEEFEEALYDCHYAPIFLGDYVDMNEIEREAIYFDNYNDEFIAGDDVLYWETEQHYYYWDGSNWQMREISEIKEIEAEFIYSEDYKRGCYQTYKLKNEKEIIIDSPIYQGSFDIVIDDYNEIIENQDV